VRVCFSDYDREIALVAELGGEILAVGRLSKSHVANEAELALLIVDEYQGHGLGTQIWNQLLEIARFEKLDQVTAEILASNRQMLEVCRQFGFHLEAPMDDVVHAVLPLF
jgi:acetyltransferase